LKNIKVYIASPYTLGDTAVNVRNSIDVFYELIKHGFIPFSPLAMCHTIQMIHPIEYEQWMQYDFEWVKTCDCLLRLPGDSQGADREIEVAKETGIPVFYSMKELLKHSKSYCIHCSYSIG
jgi:nucleoside 2-deoxyribosyltransferase